MGSTGECRWAICSSLVTGKMSSSVDYSIRSALRPSVLAEYFCGLIFGQGSLFTSFISWNSRLLTTESLSLLIFKYLLTANEGMCKSGLVCKVDVFGHFAFLPSREDASDFR